MTALQALVEAAKALHWTAYDDRATAIELNRKRDVVVNATTELLRADPDGTAMAELERKAVAWDALQNVVKQFHMFHEDRRGMDWQTCDHFRCHSNRTAIAAALAAASPEEQGE